MATELILPLLMLGWPNDTFARVVELIVTTQRLVSLGDAIVTKGHTAPTSALGCMLRILEMKWRDRVSDLEFRKRIWQETC